jgi:hypothetical protein
MAKRGDLIIKPISQMVDAIAHYGQSLFQPPQETIRGIKQDSWWSPLQPIQPFAPPGQEPSAFQWWPGQNLWWTPRADAEYSAADLKQLATYPLARICIENVKDAVTRAPWEIQLRERPNETRTARLARAKGDENILKLNRFWEYPDREHNWQEWVRPLLDDLLVIDAPSILLRKNYRGELAELAVLRGEMITRLIDQNGFTPVPPSPAYYQNWWGLPQVLLTTDQLVYKPRSIVPRNSLASQLYGMCFDDETEILTRRGWLRFKDTNQQDEFATRQINTGIFEWQKATNFTARPYDGEMLHFENRSLDLLVTPNHRMLVDSLPRALGKGKPQPKREFVIEADALAEVYSGRTGIPQWSVWNGVEITEKIFKSSVKRSGPDPIEVRMTGDQYCAFMGMYLAEGSIRRRSIQIAQKHDKRGSYELYRRLLIELLGSQPCYSGHQFEFQRRVLADFLRQFGHADTKFIPDDIRGATQRQLEIFWKYYNAGDGRNNSTPQVFTVSKKLADQLTEIIQKMGSAPTVWTRTPRIAKFPDNRKYKSRMGWLITRRPAINTKGWKATRVAYKGWIYCVTVPNGFVYVRRNGKAAFSGNSPTEQIAEEIMVGVSRLRFVRAYYEEGSVPGVVQVVPRGTSPERITEAMSWMNSELAGNLAARRQWRLVQGFNEPGKEDQIIFSKEPLLTDIYDEKHIREVAYAYGVSPQRLMKMIRTEGKSSADAAEVEGTLPWVLWVKGIVDFILQRKMGFMDYEMAINPYAEPDPLKNAAAITMYVKGGVMTPNEARKRVGEELRPEPEADRLGVITGQGFVPIGVASVVAGVQIDDKGNPKPHSVVPTQPPEPPQNGTNGKARDHNAARVGTPTSQEAGGGRSTGRNVGVDNGKESLDGAKIKKKLEKRLASRIDPDVLTPQSRQSVHAIQDAVHKVLMRQQDRARLETDRLAKTLGNILTKRKLGNVHFNLSPPDAQRVLAIPIDGQHFAAKGRDMQPHVTVLFGFHPDVSVDQINAITKGIGNIDAKVGPFEAFSEGEDGVPLVMRVESEKLRKLNADLKVLPHHETWPDYKPHVCVAYLKPNVAQTYLDRGNPLEGQTFTLSHLVHAGVDYTVRDLEKLTLPSERIKRMEMMKK